jgi:hypothetical protein
VLQSYALEEHGQVFACIPAGHMTSEADAEDHSPAAALDHTLNGSDDWTLVEDEEAQEALPSTA